MGYQKIPPEQRAHMVELYAANVDAKDIAARLGIAVSTVHRILKEELGAGRRPATAVKALAVQPVEADHTALQHAFEKHIRSRIHGHRNP